METYGDEVFIYELVRREEDPKYEGNDIRNGFADVGENSISFCERCIIENKLYMTIPAEFKPMPSWMIKKYHPYKNRPDVIFSENEKALKSVNFWLEDNPSESTEMETVLEKILAKVNPQHKIVNTVLVCSFLELDKAGVEGISVGRFELVTIHEDKEISDLMFFFPLEGQYIIGSFKAISVDLQEWMDVIVQMLCTLRIILRNEKKCTFRSAEGCSTTENFERFWKKFSVASISDGLYALVMKGGRIGGKKCRRSKKQLERGNSASQYNC